MFTGEPGNWPASRRAGPAKAELKSVRADLVLCRDCMVQAQQAAALLCHGQGDCGDWRLPNCIGSRAVRINQVAFARKLMQSLRPVHT